MKDPYGLRDLRLRLASYYLDERNHGRGMLQLSAVFLADSEATMVNLWGELVPSTKT